MKARFLNFFFCTYLIFCFVCIFSAPFQAACGNAMNPGDADQFRKISAFMAESGKVSMGFDALGSSLEMATEQRIALALQGAMTLMNSGRPSEATKKLTDILGSDLLRGNINCAVTMARCCERSGDNATALIWADMADKLEGSGAIRKSLDELLKNLKNKQNQDELAGKAMSSAMSLVKSGKTAEAARILSNIMSDMKSTRAFNGAALAMLDLCVANGMWEEGIEAADAMLPTPPPSYEGIAAEVTLKKALCLKGKKDHAAAAELFTLLGLKGTMAMRPANLHRAAIEYLSASMAEKAIASIESALPFSQGDARGEMLITLSRAQKVMKNVDGARESLKKCVELDCRYSKVAETLLSKN
ncbi:MAG: hypothetical protein CVV64_20485 [Candidatus Wallbacteria bacterium HGW-Wallbacteria-1]|jgi:tetratricopeptide (TPR) repeat protein|uniref:MalT-like TPR region domain-containing protein n=1 Tax=Candidatus Wallbacteria bacterium HGW-Wallbacteria-1 TaxID=2013854 RepID=A0A2N1PID1_9BACT|nr:MAG: hypothetical protein CVV64_20485 [Candidatus Wallbacteria bacterium HGW-Wallbacteria-1]